MLSIVWVFEQLTCDTVTVITVKEEIKKERKKSRALCATRECIIVNKFEISSM